MTTTRKTLLHRLRDPSDRAAWERFFSIYAPLLESYARASGLAAVDSEEVRDACLAVVAERLPTFEYERARGTFKGWLHKIAHGKVVDLLRRRRDDQPPTAAFLALPSAAEEPDVVWERGWREEHVRHALAEARRAESDAGREAIDLLIEEVPVPEICARTGLNANQVYKAKARMLKRVRRELRDLGVEE